MKRSLWLDGETGTALAICLLANHRRYTYPPFFHYFSCFTHENISKGSNFLCHRKEKLSYWNTLAPKYSKDPGSGTRKKNEMKGKKSRGWGGGGGVCEEERKKKSRKQDTKDYQKCNLIFFFLLSFYIASYFSSHFVNFNHRASVETNKCTLNPTGRIHYH